MAEMKARTKATNGWASKKMTDSVNGKTFLFLFFCFKEGKNVFLIIQPVYKIYPKGIQ